MNMRGSAPARFLQSETVLPARKLLAIALCGLATAAAASPESEALVRRGLAEFEAQRYRDAIHFFGEAVKADPKDLHAVFLQGATLNRLGNYREAYLLIRGVENQGGKHREIDFEAGWALMGMGRARACVDRLERFEQANPGRGQTSEFLGRCYLQLGELDRAETQFKLAVERDARLKPGIELSLARLEQARKRPDAARAHLEAASAANAPTGRALRDILGLPEPAFQPEKPLALAASLFAGRNDNVIGLGSTIPVPADITGKGALFLRANLQGAYTYVLPTRTSATLGYAGLFDRYRDLSAADLNDHFLYADLFHVVRERIGASLRVSHQYTELAGNDFRDQSTLRPALIYRLAENSVTELAWSYAFADYHAPTSGVFDRDGNAKSLALTHSWRLPRTPWSGGFGITHTRNRADGGDFSFNVNAVSASLAYELAPRITASLGISIGVHDYLNPNSLAGTGFSFARDDRQATVSAQLAGPLARGLRWFAQAQHLRSSSNIPFYDFKQNVVSAGIGASF